MLPDKKVIKKQIIDKLSHPMKMKELGKALGITSKDYAKFRNIVKSMIESGKLVKLKRGRIGIADQLNIKVGTIMITKGGTGYLLEEGDNPDVFIAPHNISTALDGDKVMVRVSGFSQDKPSGSVIKIVERTKRNIVGIFQKGKHFSCVIPDNKRIHRDIYIPEANSKKAKDGEKVVAVLTEWDDPYRNPEGIVTERLGFPGQPGVDMLTIIKSYDFDTVFPDDVMDEAERASAKLTGEEISNREDFTSDPVCTIDPADAKDHDDAISVEKTEEGFTLAVHIADVSYYIDEDSLLDKEALARGNSVYLPGTVIPMLPEILSNDVCSLKPNKKRLAHSVIINFDDKGKMLNWRFTDSIIKSKAKLSYEEVQDFFDTKVETSKINRIKKSLLHARELAAVLNKRRFKEGSLDFDLPESKIILNKDGEVIELGHKIRLESHRLVEEFMLAANQATALEIFRKAQPFIYRVHDKPDMDRLENFSALVKRLNYSFPVSKTMKPLQFAQFLDEIKDAPEADFINELMLRSMKKAVYQRENIGHFGLAFKHYTHFTSPIRRYPDLLVHRLIRKAKKGRYPHAFSKKVNSLIDRVGSHCSETERKAESAEREAVKIKQISFMAKHVGDEFSGVISGVTSYGFFVRLDRLGVEGMVRMSSIDDDYYAFEEKRYRIVGRRHGKVYQLGDKIKIMVLRVDKLHGEMDLSIVSSKTKKKTSVKKSKQHGRKKVKTKKRKTKR